MVKACIVGSKVVVSGTTGYTFFWATKSCFSNWHPVSYDCGDQTFNCSEQGMMWEKAMLFNDLKIAREIMNRPVNDQKGIKNLGRRVHEFDENVWEKNRIEIVHRHLRAKFSQNRHLYAELMGTRDTLLVEASPYDRIWGIGMNENEAKVTPESQWKGLNLLGKLLTLVREELRQK